MTGPTQLRGTMARERQHREQRRNTWLNRIEWVAFFACLIGGAALVLLVANAHP